MTLRINYVYAGGETASQPWVAQVIPGTVYDRVVESPVIAGYTADQSSIHISQTVTEDKVWTVTYTGSITTYTVNHIRLGDGVGEDIVVSEELKGTTGELTAAAARDYEGFTAGPVPQVTIQPNGSTVVNIEYSRNLYTLALLTDDGTYYPNEQYLYGETIDDTDRTPTRLGYTFDGWRNEDEEEASIPPTMPASDVTLHAAWRVNTTATYRIVYWLENLNGGDDFVAQKESTGDVGSPIEAPDLTPQEWERANIDPNGVERDPSSEEVIIKADGTAVKNVHYNRKEFSIHFITDREWIREGIFSGHWEYTEDESLRITAKYGESIISEWGDNDHIRYKWLTEWGGTTSYTMLAYMPAENITVNQGDRATGGTITWYIQSLDGKSWIQYMRVNTSASSTLTVEDQSPIEGFTWSDWQKTGKNKWLQYTRNSYSISFENCSSLPDATLKYEESLSNAKPLDSMINPPAEVDSDYTFTGWYTSPACEPGTEVDWSDTMPAHNLQIYAGWEKPKYTVSYDANGGTVNPESMTVEKGTAIDEEVLPKPEKTGDSFLGWYLDEDLTRKFVPGTQIVEDITLYAKWQSSNSVSYVVKYVDESGNSIADAEVKGPVPVGSTVEENAKEVAGYYPTMSHVSVQITETNKEVVFQYRALTEWQYTVRYENEAGVEIAKPDGPITTTDQEVVVSYKPIDGYTLTDGSATTQTATAENNEIVFTYKLNVTLYHIEYLLEQLDGSYTVDGYTTVTNQPIGEDITLSVEELPTYTGFELNEEMSVLSGETNAEDILTLQVYYSRIDYGYAVNYYYEDGDGIVNGDLTKHDNGKGEFESKIPYSTTPAYDNYVYDRAVPVEGGDGTITADPTKNVMNVYFALDEIGTGENPNEGDGTPDKYQITFTYVTEDAKKGTVTGTTTEVKTIRAVSYTHLTLPTT